MGELAKGLPVSRPAVSQHLKVLREVDPDGVTGMREYLDRFWSDALAAFEKAARAGENR